MALASSTSRDRYKPTRRHVVTALFATALLVSPASIAVFVHKQTTSEGKVRMAQQSKVCCVKTYIASSASMTLRSAETISQDCGRRTASLSITTRAMKDIQVLTMQLRCLSKSFRTSPLPSAASFRHSTESESSIGDSAPPERNQSLPASTCL
jgi:hypothetical protein